MMLRTAVVAIGLVACSKGTTAPPTAPTNVPRGTTTVATPAAPAATGDTVGTAHAIVVEAVARDGGWIVICQARADTDGDGEIAVHAGMHGDTYGDRFQPYLVRGSGDGEPIDTLVGHSRDGRWLVAFRDGALAVLDVAAGTWTVLPHADLRDDGVPMGPHRAASIAGGRMTYFRDDETLVVRTLATGAERAVKVAGAKLWRVELEPSGDWGLVFAIRTDTDNDGTLSWPSVHTSLSGRGCRGPISSFSTGRWDGDEPEQLWLDLAAGAIVAARPPTAAPAADDDEPDHGLHQGRKVLAVDRAGRKLIAPIDDGRDLPRGPLMWVTP